MFFFKNKQTIINQLIGQASAEFQSGRFNDAQATYQRILKDDKANVIALNELGRIYLQHRKLEDAASLFRQAVTAHPDIAIPYKNLGTTLYEMGLYEEGFTFLRRYAELSYPAAQQSASPHKLLHDSEQMAYLRNDKNAYTITEAERINGRALNPELAARSVIQRWEEKKPSILVFDDFLTPDALRRLQQFAWGSTIWQRVYKNGYLGALPEHGLGSPLLAQIIDELKASLPSILGDMSLLQFWSFKYDSAMKGIGLHADFATININFWITPDDANLNAEGGGMIIWDKPAPMDWDFKTYNQNEDAARAFLTEKDAAKFVIPYRANRVVIFDSSLFHETDTILFQQGYINRRIGFTLLFGKRDTGRICS